jgi:hypothetical protein
MLGNRNWKIHKAHPLFPLQGESLQGESLQGESLQGEPLQGEPLSLFKERGTKGERLK